MDNEVKSDRKPKKQLQIFAYQGLIREYQMDPRKVRNKSRYTNPRDIERFRDTNE